MRISAKLRMADRMNTVFERFSSKLTTACKRYCARCCTCDVTMTSLEAYIIVEHVIKTGQKDLLETLACLPESRFRPKITTNALALCHAQGREPPEEEINPGWGKCPFLTNDECPIYEVRPFGCRCFVSRQDCMELGAADIEDFVITVSTVFMQYFEHIDAGGLFGNFGDMLLFMASDENRNRYRNGVPLVPEKGLISNMPVRVLMIPPEHREMMRPILDSANPAIPFPD